MKVSTKETFPVSANTMLILQGEFSLTEEEVLVFANKAGQFLGNAFYDALKTVLVDSLIMDHTIPNKFEAKACLLNCQPNTMFLEWSFNMICIDRFV